MNEHFYCGALSKDGLPCVRFKDHGDVHMANGKTGTACMWPVTPDEQTKADAWKAKYESEEDAITEEFGLQAICRACDGEGVLRFEGHPYGLGFGKVVETIPCACQPVAAPREYTLREVRQRMAVLHADAEDFLRSRGEGTMSEILLGPPPVRR